MKPIYGFIIFILLLIGIAATVLIFNNSEDTATQKTQEFSEQDIVLITAETVAMHAVAEDCWTIVEDKVYDITSYIPRHPGGSEILRTCGSDGTTLFTQRTTADGESVGSGTPHSSTANSLLADFYVGDLAS